MGFRDLSCDLAGGHSYTKWHEMESQAIASRCPKLRTPKGHLVYEWPPARSQLRSRKPIQRHACYKRTRSTHALYEQQVPLQFSTKYTFIDNSYRVHTEITSMWSNITTRSGSKLCLSTDKFNKWLKKPYLNTKPSTREPVCWLGLD